MSTILRVGFFARLAWAAAAACGLLGALAALVAGMRRRQRPGPRLRRALFSGLVGAAAGWILVPPALVAYVARFSVGTRPDERGYAGPLVRADGSWTFQRRGALLPAARIRAESLAERVDLVASDGVELRAFFVRALGGSPRFDALLVHGLFRNALELERPAAAFHALGGNVLLLELRNHGGSGRSPPGFGSREALDVEAGARFLDGLPGADSRPLVLFGVSLGAGAAALAAPNLRRLGGLVLDSPFPDFARAFDHLAASPRVGMSRLHRFLALRLVALTCSLSWRDVRPVEALRQLGDVRLLVVGARTDIRTPPEDVREVFESAPLAPDRKELWIVDGTRHGHAFTDAPEAYRRRIRDLVEAVSVDRAGGGPPQSSDRRRRTR